MATVAAVSTAVGVLTWPEDDSDLVAVPAPPSESPSPKPEPSMDAGIIAALTHDNFEYSSLLPVGRGANQARVGLPTAPEVNDEDTNKLNKPSTIATTSVAPVDATKGTLLSMPLNGRQTSQFGMRFHPVLKVWKLHTGLDFAAPCGTAVGAVAPGEVIRTGWAGGNGIQVKVDHGKIADHHVITTYNHLSSVGVSVGQKVDTHQGLGEVGSTGYSTGCHLHLELIVDGDFTDPLPWLNGDPVVVDINAITRRTPSPRPSVSPSSSASPSPSPSPSRSASASPSPSPSPSASASKTPKPSKTPSPKPGTPEPSGTPSQTVSPSPSPEPSESPSPSSEPSESPSASASETPSSEPTATETESEPETESPSESEPENDEPAPTLSSDETLSVPEPTGSSEETD